MFSQIFAFSQYVWPYCKGYICYQWWKMIGTVEELSWEPGRRLCILTLQLTKLCDSWASSFSSESLLSFFKSENDEFPPNRDTGKMMWDVTAIDRRQSGMDAGFHLSRWGCLGPQSATVPNVSLGDSGSHLLQLKYFLVTSFTSLFEHLFMLLF